MFEAVFALIKQAPRIILHRHSHPDGDALGSQLGMKALLLENFPEKEVLAVGDEAGRYRFMADSRMDEVPEEAFADALCLLLDVPAADMVSDPRFSRAAHTARIDHHPFTGTFTQAEVVDTSFESCAGMVAALAMEQGLRLNKQAAEALFTGMVTDSGRFRYDCVSARSFTLAAFLMSQPIDTQKLYSHLYRESPDLMLKRAEYASRMQLTPAGVAWVYSDADRVNAMGMSPFALSRSMVNTMADLEGVLIWVNFTESPEGILVEIRSGGPNINPLAVKYGGGGHAKASGTTLHSQEQVLALLKDLNALAQKEKAHE